MKSFSSQWRKVSPASDESNILTSSYSPEDKFELVFVIFLNGFREP